jgi:hypothetical protein
MPAYKALWEVQKTPLERRVDTINSEEARNSASWAMRHEVTHSTAVRNEYLVFGMGLAATATKASLQHELKTKGYITHTVRIIDHIEDISNGFYGNPSEASEDAEEVPASIPAGAVVLDTMGFTEQNEDYRIGTPADVIRNFCAFGEVACVVQHGTLERQKFAEVIVPAPSKDETVAA